MVTIVLDTLDKTLVLLKCIPRDSYLFNIKNGELTYMVPSQRKSNGYDSIINDSFVKKTAGEWSLIAISMFDLNTPVTFAQWLSLLPPFPFYVTDSALPYLKEEEEPLAAFEQLNIALKKLGYYDLWKEVGEEFVGEEERCEELWRKVVDYISENHENLPFGEFNAIMNDVEDVFSDYGRSLEVIQEVKRRNENIRSQNKEIEIRNIFIDQRAEYVVQFRSAFEKTVKTYFIEHHKRFTRSANAYEIDLVKRYFRN